MTTGEIKKLKHLFTKHTWSRLLEPSRSLRGAGRASPGSGGGHDAQASSHSHPSHSRDHQPGALAVSLDKTRHKA